MASSGGHWVKIAQGDIGAMVFVPQGKTVEQVLVGKKPAGSTWPASINDVKVIKGLGGSTGAQLVQDSDGNLYVMKKGGSAGHLLSEIKADSYYQTMGVDVPKSKLYGDANNPVKLTRYVEGQTLQQAQANDPTAYNKAVKALQNNFAADVLLGNWDVVGLNKDNILIDKGGKVWRIDNGGALAYRAQGGLKGSAWGNTPGEVFTMRTKGSAASIFGSMTLPQIANSINNLSSNLGTGGTLEPILKARFNNLKSVAELIGTGMPDQALQEYLGW